MNKKISILGCGWLGIPLTLKLSQKGHQVCGSTTSPDKLSTLESNGITPFLVDIDNESQDYADFLDADVLVIAITSKNTARFQRLIREIEKSGLRKVVFVSSTSVYPNTNGIVTEETETLQTPLAEIERMFSGNSGLQTTIVRFAGLFGYERKPGNFFKPGRVIDHPEGFVNMIHQDDCVNIIQNIIAQELWNEVLNACSSSHPTRRDYYLNEAQKVGRTDLQFNEQSENKYKIVSNQKLKEVLSYSFKYDDLMQ
jgi:nucleoside-diphosphate-sugar epimerase